MASQPSEKPRGLPNPYAAKGLPNPYALATVAESAPVKFSEEQAKAEQKKTPAFHNPHHIKRPQAKGATVKKPAISRPVMSSAPSDPVAAAAPSQQPSLDWWRSTADDDAAALDYKRQVNREQKEKKKQERKFARQFGWWKGEAPYKADKPSNLKAYKASGGYRYKLESFDIFLRSQAGPSRSRRSDSERTKDSRPASSESEQAPESAPKSRFAPPARYDQESTLTPPALVQDDRSGEDAYARRARLAQTAVPSPPPPPPSEPQTSHPPPPPASESYAAVPPPPPPPETSDAIPPPPPPSSTSYNPTISAPPVRYNPTISAPSVHYSGATISAPPVRYNVTNVQMNDDMDKPSPDERPAKRPRISKAEAMMAKMGYVKGQGLGKNSDGITTHLEVKARKNDRRVDISDHNDENGKNIKSQQVFDILGGRITKRKEPDRFGEESKVVVAWGCVDGIDWGADADRDDGGIRQELGQTFDNKFGRVERVYVNLSGDQQPVYIKFSSELSALNAVNRFHEGYQFRGRDIRALYYNEAKFEASIFDH